MKLELKTVCLILAPDPKAVVKKVLEGVHEPVITMTRADFSAGRFLEEVETLFQTKRIVCVFDLDACTAAECQVIVDYLKRPSPHTSLLLAATTLHASSKLYKEVQKQGSILNLTAEKPWEREKALIEHLLQRAKESGLRLSPVVAKELIHWVGKEEAVLNSELEKLICFVGEKKEIQSSDIEMLCEKAPETNLWALSDAILSQDFPLAHALATSLMQNNVSMFALLAHLKNQTKTHLEMLSLFEQEGLNAVSARFPYLKGALLHKKMELLKLHSKNSLQQHFVELFNHEIHAKNGVADPALLFELLLVKLTRTLD